MCSVDGESERKGEDNILIRCAVIVLFRDVNWLRYGLGKLFSSKSVLTK